MGSLAIARLSIVETMRRREFYVILALVLGLAAWIQTMDLNTSGAGRFAKDIIMQITWLASFALAAPLAARQIPSDLEQRTAYVMMARPMPRWQYVLGKALGASLSAIACFVALFAVLVVMMLTKGAASVADGSLWQAFALQIIALVMLCTLAVFFSVVGTPSGAVTFSFVLFAVMRYGGHAIFGALGNMVAGTRELAWAAYLAMPHFEFFAVNPRVVHEWGALPAGLFFQIAAYGIAYSVAMVSLSALLFRRRWL